MRMWMLPPNTLCNKHLIGEHGEIHKHRHVFVKHYSIAGRVSHKGIQIEPLAMESRHDALAHEMQLRGFNHFSPYEQPDLAYLPAAYREAKVDLEASRLDLHERCQACKILWKNFMAAPLTQEEEALCLTSR